MIILLAVIVAAVIAALASVMLISLASKREDSAQSLSGRPSGRLEAAGRRILGFHGDGIACRPAAGRARPRQDNRVLDGTGQNGTGIEGTGLDRVKLDNQPDVPHLVG